MEGRNIPAVDDDLPLDFWHGMMEEEEAARKSMRADRSRGKRCKTVWSCW
jgi:hypothetical protein